MLLPLFENVMVNYWREQPKSTEDTKREVDEYNTTTLAM